MITKIINPESITKKVSNSGKDFLSIEGKDGEWYQIWNPKLFHSFFENKPIKVKIQQIRDFNNVVGIEGQVKGKELKAMKKEEKIEFDKRTKGMARGACFNKACDIVIALYQKGKVKEKNIPSQIEKVFKELQKILSE